MRNRIPDRTTIKIATPADAERLLQIYAPYVTDTAISFEYTVPSVTEFRTRINNTLQKYPYLVAEHNGQIVGYTYAGPFIARAAYGWNVETTIYLQKDKKKAGIGRALYEALEKGETLPLEMKGNVIYYMGPSPAREGRPIGSAGPTTASRMDKYAPALLDLGLIGMIGKGKRSDAVKEAIVRNSAVYFAAVGGAGALLAGSIKASEVIAYDDLGTEAIRRLEVENFPVIVVIDSKGQNLYETAIREYFKL